VSRSEKSDDDIVIAEAVELTGIPVIDFTRFLTGDTGARRAIAKEIAAACTEIGFFYLAGHGVPQTLQAAIFEQSALFFRLSEGEKLESQATADWFRGWVPPPGTEKLSRDTRLFHQYLLQLQRFPDRAIDPDTCFLDWPNRWPGRLPAFKVVVEQYLEAMHQLSTELLRAFALGLDLPENRFADAFRNPPSLLSLQHYPPLPEGAEIDVSNIVSHTDEGPITILAQGDIGGLEVKRRDGIWIQAPPIPGTFTINVGDMMMWWSNGEYLSNYHRVRNRAAVERFSIPFFSNPDRDVVVEPLPELFARTGPPKFAPVRVSEQLNRFYVRQRRHAGMIE
jgi:isopenicillin N synthase-like dioxygenase